MLELVIGGARSGKSAYAERCALSSGLDVIYIATATAGDGEMRQRIEHHQQSRPGHWRTVEEPIALAKALDLTGNVFVIVDCLTLWMSNILDLAQQEYQNQLEQFYAALNKIQYDLIFVSNEVGMGIVPLGEQTRRFVDETGRMHQRLAGMCQRVTQVSVGIAQRIKDE